MRLDIYILDTRLDTFKTDAIRLKSSITNSQDLSKISTDYTQTFNLPASKRNNIFFKHYYNATIDNTFDARTKQAGRVELNGLPFRYGKFRLLKVAATLNKPSSYTVSFVGNLVDLKKQYQDDKLAALDLSAYDHDFDGDTVLEGLQTGLFGGDLIYTLNPKKQYYYNSDPTDVTNTDKITNIAYNAVNPDPVHGVSFSDLSPSLKAGRILDAIEAYRPTIIYSRDFFGSSTFEDLYMGLVNKEGSVGGNNEIIDWDGGSTTYVNLATNTGTFVTNATDASGDNRWFILKLKIIPHLDSMAVNYNVTIIINGEDVGTTGGIGTEVFQWDDLESDGDGEVIYTVQYRIQSNETFTYTANWNQREQANFGTIAQVNTTASASTLTSLFLTGENLPDITIIDWLTSFFKAYKLVAIPQDDGTIYVQNLDAYYADGTLWRVSKYVDWTKEFVERGKIFSEIKFNFEDPTTILAQQFDKNTGTPYGNEEVMLREDPADITSELLDGPKYDISVPFETGIFDRLTDQDTDLITDIMYLALVDESINPAVPAPMFYYSTPRTTQPIKYINDNSVPQKIIGAIQTAHHSKFISGNGTTFLFSAEFSEWSGALMESTLYKYHENYILSLFNIKRRDFKFTINLPYFILSRLKLNDVFEINGQYFRIDNYDTNLTEAGASNFTLINSFDNDLSKLTVGPTAYTVEPGGGVVVIIIAKPTTGTAVTTPLIDLGFGTTWVTTDIQAGHINVTVERNQTYELRNIYIDVTNPNGDKTTQRIYLSQQGGTLDDPVTWDSTLVTFDNTNITFDNG